MKIIDSAIEFANKKFDAVSKKNHFLRVCAIIKDEFKVEDVELLAAAILHDTLEDTDTTYEELEQNFSKTIADLVQEVSHPKNYNHEEKLQYYQKLKTVTPKAKIIKLADFADNLKNIIATRKLNPENPYYNEYILLIRDFLESCLESNAKKSVFTLTQELETYVVE